MMNLSPIEIAKQIAARQQGGGQSRFFSLQDGESKVVRFLTGLEASYVVSHGCGVSMIDIPKRAWDEAESVGAAVNCPQCGQPLTRENIDFERPSVEGVHMHRFVQTSDPNVKGNFACLGSVENAMLGITEATPDGQPMYQCPICSSPQNLNKNGQPKKPSYRLYAVAVERDVKQEVRVINGLNTPVTVGVQDVYETEDDGQTHPRVVIVEMGWKGFWSKVAAYGFDSICYYDWRVTRMGSGLDTTYEVQPMNPEKPDVVDMRQYQQWMPDVRAMLQGLASPDYYVKKGWSVPGYVGQSAAPGASAAQGMVQQAAQQYAQPAPQVSPAVQEPQGYQQAPQGYPQAAQGYQQAPQGYQQQPTGGMNGWDVVAGQVRQ